MIISDTVCKYCGKKLSANDTICPNGKYAFTDKLPNTPDDNSLQSSEFKTTESVREEINSETNVHTNVHLNDFDDRYGDSERRNAVNNYKKTSLIVLGIIILVVVAVTVAVYFS